MKNYWLLLSLAGYAIPNYFVFLESVETGNILSWLKPTATLEGMFGNNISTAFIMDLLFVVLVFFVYTFYDSKKAGIKRVWIYWVLTMLFGLAGTWPLYLHYRNKNLST